MSFFAETKIKTPVVISLPHFLYAEKQLQQAVVGLSPIEDEHQTVVDLEPNTGVGVNFQRRIQMNALIYRDLAMRCF